MKFAQGGFLGELGVAFQVYLWYTRTTELIEKELENVTRPII